MSQNLSAVNSDDNQNNVVEENKYCEIKADTYAEESEEDVSSGDRIRRPILINPVPVASPPFWEEVTGVPLSIHNQMCSNRDVQVDIKSESDVKTVNIRAHEGSSVASTDFKEPQVHADWFGGGQVRQKIIRAGCTHDVDGACALCHNIRPPRQNGGSKSKKVAKSSKDKSNEKTKISQNTKQLSSTIKTKNGFNEVKPCFVKDCPGGCGNVHPDGKVSRSVNQPKEDKPLGEFTDLKDLNKETARKWLGLDGSESGSGSSPSSPSGSGSSSSSSSGSSSSTPPSDDGDRPIRQINYQGHFMYDNYENRKLTSETRVFRVPQALFHGIVSKGLMSQTTMVQHFGFYYRLEFIDVEMPVSIVNEIKAFWKATTVRDILNYEKSEFLAVQLLRNADVHSKIYQRTILFAPLLAFYEAEPRNRYTTPLIYEKMWSWNFCFFLWFLFAGIDKLLFGRVYNIFWVALLFLLSLTLRFAFGSLEFENLFCRFSRLKLLLSCSFAACYLFWYLLLNAIYNYDIQYISYSSNVPWYSNSTIVWNEVNYTSVEFGTYNGPAVFPVTITTLLLIIYARMAVLYTPAFLVRGNHLAFPLGSNWNRQFMGLFQIRSICSPSVVFAFIQIVLYYLYCPYWLGFGLYILMLVLNRRVLSRLNIPINYRFLTIDAQFY